MKIAFVGKGGSGKSSLSWLAVKTLEDIGETILAIDADHNMDLTSNLGINPDDTPLMKTTDKEFMERAGLTCGENCEHKHDREHTYLHTFSLDDDYTKSISIELSKNLKLVNIGLGSPDVLFSSTCAHGLSGPLKYYLGLLDEKNSWVIIDSVAGADMLNYGLYSGIDAVIGVVEPHRNSVKVFEQIQDICRKTMIPCYAVINKPSDNDFYNHFKEDYKNIILGEIPLDEAILDYNYTHVANTTKNSMKSTLEKIGTLKKRGNLNV